MADGDDPKDVFKQFSESTVEQVANVAQLAAEARRLGLIPEFPRELIEKLDVGGTLLDLFRLQLKHTTALASILGPQARNLEKLNHWSALISTSKSSAPHRIQCECKPGGVAAFDLSVDNPIDRTQKLSVSLSKLHCQRGAPAQKPKSKSVAPEKPKPTAREFEAQPVPAEGRKPAAGLTDPIVWSLSPLIDEVEPHALRSCQIVFDLAAGFDSGEIYETTAIVRLSPLGSLQRYQLHLTVAK
jgi:hypothetical protein